jgi:hypothetical protein
MNPPRITDTNSNHLYTTSFSTPPHILETYESMKIGNVEQITSLKGAHDL